MSLLPYSTIVEITKISYGGLIFLLFIFGTDLLKRYFQADKQTRGDAAYKMFFFIGIGVLGDSIYTVFAVNNFFYETRDWLLTMQNLISIGIIILLALATEKLILKKKQSVQIGKENISILSVIAIGSIIYVLVSFIMDIFDSNDVQDGVYTFVVNFIMALFGLIAFIGIVSILIYQLRPQKEIRHKMVMAMIYVLIGIGGGVFRLLGRMYENELLILGLWIEIVVWLGIRWNFLGIRSYSELEWREGLLELHIVLAESGVALHSHTFKTISPSLPPNDLKTPSKSSEPDLQRSLELIGGGMVGIKTMLGEITGSKGKLHHIQIGNVHMCCVQGKQILTLLFTEKHLGVYYNILLKFVEALEYANPNLNDFDGNVGNLQIIPILENIFGIPPTKPSM